MYNKLMRCLACVREKTDFKPEVALILGSGLGDFADEIKIEGLPVTGEVCPHLLY